MENFNNKVREEKEQRQLDLIDNIPNRLMETCFREISDLFGGLQSMLFFIAQHSEMPRSDAITKIMQRHATNSIFNHPYDHDECLIYLKSIQQTQLVKSFQIPFMINKHIAELCVGVIHQCSNQRCVSWFQNVINPCCINNNRGQIVLLAENKHRMCSETGNVFCDKCGSCSGQHHYCDQCRKPQCLLDSNKCRIENCMACGDICQHIDMGTCEQCNDYVCEDHYKECNVCGIHTCNDCDMVDECNACKRLICWDHSQVCNECMYMVCLDDDECDQEQGIFCVVCDDWFCANCLSKNKCQCTVDNWCCLKCKLKGNEII
eukprot:518523_1